MKCKWPHINLGFRFGDIHSMCEEAVALAEHLDTKVSFDFNGVCVNVTGETNPEDIANKALRAVQSKARNVYGEGY